MANIMYKTSIVIESVMLPFFFSRALSFLVENRNTIDITIDIINDIKEGLCIS
ncbi:MAG: hypothetical protein LBG13_00915 [Holosporales bacterium]|nr:hypothetical protein [Holosporales bacterium]